MATDKIKRPMLKGMAPLMQVFDMPRSLRFYRDILGFAVISSSAEGDDADWVLLKYNDITLMLNTAYESHTRPGAEDPQRTQVHQDTTMYFGCADIESAFEYLKSQGVSLNPPSITGYGWKAISFSDPDGYGICFHWPQE